MNKRQRERMKKTIRQIKYRLDGRKSIDFTAPSATIKLRDVLFHEDRIEIFDDVPDEEWTCTNPIVKGDEGNSNSGFHDHPGNPPNVGGSRSIGAWPSDFPKVCVQTNGKTMKSHEMYSKAKAGDYDSAKALVSDLVKKKRIDQLAESYPDAIVVPVQSKGKGHNQIPVAYADAIGEAGLTVDKGIQITEKANRTGTSEMHRMTSRNKIVGDVKKGTNYIIVDDVVTSGASINEYRQYIEKHGGVVVAATTLCMDQAGSNQISPTKEAIEKAKSKHGEERIKKLCKAIGVEHGLESMTNWQVNYIRSFGTKKIDGIIEGAK